MSTLVSSGNSQELKSVEDLAHYFDSHAKAPKNFRLGLEAEFFAVDKFSGEALPYLGQPGIQKLLLALTEKFSYTPVYDLQNVIALRRGDTIIALEPGGQIELSAPPVARVSQIKAQIELFCKELKFLESVFPSIRFIAVGLQPFSRLEDIPWVPKRRYKIMADWMASRGSLSHHMMKCTATNQINLDYSSEADAMGKFRVALAATSLITALFANSSFAEGKPNGFSTYRLEIWNHTDPDRTGLLADFLKPGKTFKDYLNYVLDIPVFFIVRNNDWIPLNGLSFRDFIKTGFQNHRATLDDFELHLSTAFPEVRLKQYLEIRGIDCQTPKLIPSVAALWKGLLYDSTALRDAEALLEFASPEERLALHCQVPIQGLRATLAGKPILPLVTDLVEIARQGLRRQASPQEDESLFLAALQATILNPQKSPGQPLVEKWETQFHKKPSALIEYLGI